MQINYWDKARELLPNSNCLRRSYAAIIVSEWGETIGAGYNESIEGCKICAREGKEHNSGNYTEGCSIHAEQMALLMADIRDLNRSTLYLVCNEEKKPVPCPTCEILLDYCGVTLKGEPNGE